jgi:hypothetical protein
VPVLDLPAKAAALVEATRLLGQARAEPVPA